MENNSIAETIEKTVEVKESLQDKIESLKLIIENQQQQLEEDEILISNLQDKDPRLKTPLSMSKSNSMQNLSHAPGFIKVAPLMKSHSNSLRKALSPSRSTEIFNSDVKANLEEKFNEEKSTSELTSSFVSPTSIKSKEDSENSKNSKHFKYKQHNNETKSHLDDEPSISLLKRASSFFKTGLPKLQHKKSKDHKIELKMKYGFGLTQKDEKNIRDTFEFVNDKFGFISVQDLIDRFSSQYSYKCLILKNVNKQINAKKSSKKRTKTPTKSHKFETDWAWNSVKASRSTWTVNNFDQYNIFFIDQIL